MLNFFFSQALPVIMRVTNREILDLLVTGEPGRFLFGIRYDVYITVLSVKHSKIKTCTHRKCCMMASCRAVRSERVCVNANEQRQFPYLEARGVTAYSM